MRTLSSILVKNLQSNLNTNVIGENKWLLAMEFAKNF